MSANLNILSALNDHVFSKTGKRVLDTGNGGDPPTGGDKNKGKGKVVAQPTDGRIPMFDPNDPASRLKYVETAAKKYNLPKGSGDAFTRFNEIPDTRTDTLTTRQIMANTAPASGLPTPLFYASAMNEGMTGIYPHTAKGYKGVVTDWSENEKFPVSGYVNFGLDTFSDAFPGLVKKGYLPADFSQQFVSRVHPARKGDNKVPVNSADFASAQAASQAKAAMLRDAQDQVNAYAVKNKIPLSDKAKQFLTLAYYNGGPGAFQGMIQEAQKSGGLANDAYFTKKPLQSKYGKVWNNVNDRFRVAGGLTGEGYQFKDTPPLTTLPVIPKQK